MKLATRSASLGVVALITSYAHIASAQCAKAARDQVTRFFELDREGYRLSSGGTHEAIWKLTEENGEPLDDPITLVRSFRIVTQAPLSHGVCAVTVEFVVLGKFRQKDYGGLRLIAHGSTRETRRVFMNCSSGICLVNIDPDHFTIPPHIGQKAALAWLDLLIGIQTRKSAADELRVLRSRVARLEWHRRSDGARSDRLKPTAP